MERAIKKHRLYLLLLVDLLVSGWTQMTGSLVIAVAIECYGYVIPDVSGLYIFLEDEKKTKNERSRTVNVSTTIVSCY